MSSFSIAYFGLPLGALLLARDGHDLGLVALSRTDAVGLRRARRVFGDRLIVKPKPDDPDVARRVKELAPDLVVSWFWTKKLPMTIVRAARLGGIGAHPSLLPRHRGPDPTFWAIASGDAETGVTIHRLEAEYDTGEILAQEALAISPTIDAWRLARALDRPSLRLLRATVRRFARGEVVEGRAQDESLATPAPFPDDEACSITWSWPTKRVLDHVRALAPSPGAWTEVDGSVLVVSRAEARAKPAAPLEPGEGVVLEGAAVVRTGDGAVALFEGEIDGEPAGREAIAALFADRAR